MSGTPDPRRNRQEYLLLKRNLENDGFRTDRSSCIAVAIRHHLGELHVILAQRLVRFL